MKNKSKLLTALAMGVCICFTQCKKTVNPAAADAAKKSSLKTNTLTAHPNVLFIVVDDLRYWTIHKLWQEAGVGRGAGHNTEPITPNIDALIAESVTFTNAHSAAVECCPSRTAFLSGQYPYQTGVYSNADDIKAITPSTTLFAQFASDPTNYFARAAGKVFHCDPDEYYAGGYHFPTTQGYSVTGNTVLSNTTPGYDFRIINTNKLDDREGGTDASKTDLTEDAKAVNFCISSMDTVKNYNVANPTAKKSFFMVCGIRRPHYNLIAPQYYYDKYVSGGSNPPVTPDVVPTTLTGLPQMAQDLAAGHQPTYRSDDMILSRPSEWNHYLRAYMACVSYTDYQIGRLMTYLHASGMNNNTIVVLISDHGFHLGDKHHIKKTTLWEETTHVPMIWRVPGVNANTRCKAAVDLMSIYPTLMQYCNKTKPSWVSGQNIKSLIDAPGGPTSSYYAFTTTADMNGAGGATRPMISVRNDDYRLTQYNRDTNQEELYDHATDLLEAHTLYNVDHSAEPGWSVTLRNKLPSGTNPYHDEKIGVVCADE